MKRKVKPEAKVKKQCKAVLDSIGAYYFFPIASAMGRAGVPDIIGCYNGRFFGIECKAGGNKTTGLQDAQLAKITAAGGVAMIINENNIDDILHKLGEL